ncbi:vWA domain-containing protein [Propionibacteriaceae bacterium Y1685]|uniref:vWA domain-containing protein n=1 Tax=Microlunatus sp. Y1700 TaxID=3418487 RepID=UPI003B77858F
MSLHPNIPAVLLCLLAAVALVVLHRRGAQTRRTEPSAPWYRRLIWRRVAMVLLVAVISLRPTVGSEAGRGQSTDVDVLILLDRTLSMAAEDWNGAEPRINGVRADTAELVEQYAGARFSLISFDSGARVESPWTTDGTAVQSLVDAMTLELTIYSKGTSIDQGVELAAQTLSEAAESDPGRTRVVVLMTDGEQTRATAPEPFTPLTENSDGGLVLGYGTTAGGPMRNPLVDEYITDPKTGDNALSHLDEAALQKAAQEMDASYVLRSSPGRIPDLPRGGFGALTGGETVTGAEVYPLAAIGLLGLVLAELWTVATTWLSVRRERESLP